MPVTETSVENSFEIFFCRLFHCKTVVSQNSEYDTGQRSEMLVRSFFMHHQAFEGTCHFCDDMRGNIERAAVDRVEDLILAESVHITAIVIFLSDTFELFVIYDLGYHDFEYTIYSNFRKYAHPLHVKEGIITEKVFPVFSKSFFWTCFGLVMYIWELMGVTEKLAFQM